MLHSPACTIPQKTIVRKAGMYRARWVDMSWSWKSCPALHSHKNLKNKRERIITNMHFLMNYGFLVLTWNNNGKFFIVESFFFFLWLPICCILFRLKQNFQNFKHLVVTWWNAYWLGLVMMHRPHCPWSLCHELKPNIFPSSPQ